MDDNELRGRREEGTYHEAGDDEELVFVAYVCIPNSAVEFEVFVVPEPRVQAIPPKTWERKSSSCERR